MIPGLPLFEIEGTKSVYVSHALRKYTLTFQLTLTISTRWVDGMWYALSIHTSTIASPGLFIVARVFVV